jgi:hypothetical protein
LQKVMLDLVRLLVQQYLTCFLLLRYVRWLLKRFVILIFNYNILDNQFFFSKKALYLDWYPLTRDCFFYTISVGSLIAVLYDGKIYWYTKTYIPQFLFNNNELIIFRYEATVLLVLYFVYIIFMYFNNRIEKFVKLKSKHIYFIYQIDQIY